MSGWPETLPGLNIKQALSQLGGKKALYVRLLGMFEGSHAEDGNRIIEAAKQEDWDAVHDINHALKGYLVTWPLMSCLPFAVPSITKSKTAIMTSAKSWLAFHMPWTPCWHPRPKRKNYP